MVSTSWESLYFSGTLIIKTPYYPLPVLLVSIYISTHTYCSFLPPVTIYRYDLDITTHWDLLCHMPHYNCLLAPSLSYPSIKS